MNNLIVDEEFYGTKSETTFLDGVTALAVVLAVVGVALHVFHHLFIV